MQNKLFIYLGNLLIIISTLSLIYTYYPILRLYILKSDIKVSANDEDSIFIPSINAYAPIIENVDPWDKSEYSKALENGVAQAKGMGEVGKVGRVFIFAHSSDAPWRMTRYNTPFLLLPRVKIGDEITIRKRGEKYVYRVTKLETVNPSSISVITQVTDKKELVLQTCTPPGTDLKRLLVYSELVE